MKEEEEEKEKEEKEKGMIREARKCSVMEVDGGMSDKGR